MLAIPLPALPQAETESGGENEPAQVALLRQRRDALVHIGASTSIVVPALSVAVAAYSGQTGATRLHCTWRGRASARFPASSHHARRPQLPKGTGGAHGRRGWHSLLFHLKHVPGVMSIVHRLLSSFAK